MQPKDWNKIRNILEEQLAGYIGQDEETVNAKLDALVTSLTGELTANVVKKVQRGTTKYSKSAYIDVTISPVNMDKTITNCNVHQRYGADGEPSYGADCRLLSETTLRLYSDAASDGYYTSWEVIEFY